MKDKTTLEESKLPPHLRNYTHHRQCSKCGRKSWGEQVNTACAMPQPDGTKCTGILEGVKE